MADDVTRSEVLSEPVGEAGAKPTESTDMPGSADPGSARKKKRVRKKPAAGESKSGEKKDVRKDAENEGMKKRRVRKKRTEYADNDAAQPEDGAGARKKKVHIKKADTHTGGEQSKTAQNSAGTSGAANQSAGASEKAVVGEKKPGTVKNATDGEKKSAEAKKNTADGKKKPAVMKKAADGNRKPADAKKAVRRKKTVGTEKRTASVKESAGENKAVEGEKAAPAKRAVKLKEVKPAALLAAAKTGLLKALHAAADAIRKLLLRIPEKNRKKILLTLAAVLGVYLFFVIVFSFIFMPRTYLNGIKVSLKSYVSSSKLIKPLIDDYELTIYNLDGSQDKVEGSTVHLKYESMKWIKKALRKQNQFAWPISFFRKNVITVEEDVSYDTDVFKHILEKLSGFRTTTMIEPQDAHVAMDETGNYVVFPEVLGTTIDVRAAEEAARECLLTGNPELKLEDYHLLPKVYSTDEKLGTRLREWNEYMKSVGLTYIFWDTPEVLTREVIDGLISDDGDKLYVDKAKVMKMMAVWAERHDSLGRPFTFKTYNGEEVQIASGGDYGYELNEEAVAEDLMKKLDAHDTGSYEVSYWRKPLYTTNNGLGDTYIEVSLSNQHLWMYKDGQLVIDTPVVTGTPTDDGERITHKGCYSVDWHDTDVQLGTMETRGYEQHVKYWIAFNQSEGIHDATWREDAEFGGDTYMYSGSHGCVNTPISAMSVIYDAVIDGEAVVVY